MSKVTYSLSDGRKVRIPVEKAEEFQALWTSKGLQFQPVEAEGAEPPPNAQAPGFVGYKPPAQGDPELEAAQAQDAARPLQALGRGAAQGASMGASDESAGFGAWLANGAAPREKSLGYEAGKWLATGQAPKSYTGMRDSERDANANAARTQPVPYYTGEVFGSAAPAVAMGGAAELAPTVGGRIGEAAIAGGATGLMEGYNRSAAPDRAGQARDALTGAGVGTVAGAAGEAVLPPLARWLGAGANKAGAAARTFADEQKVAAAGAERGAMKNLRKADGGVRRYAEGAERLDIGRNRAGAIPATVRQHANDAEIAQDVAQARKDAIAEKISAQGVMVDGAEVARRIRALAPHKKGPGRVLHEIADTIAKDFEDLGVVPFAEMNEVGRQQLGKLTNFEKGTPQQELRQKAYMEVNNAMADAVDSPLIAPPAAQAESARAAQEAANGVQVPRAPKTGIKDERFTVTGEGLEPLDVDLKADIAPRTAGTVRPGRIPADVHAPTTQAMRPPSPVPEVPAPPQEGLGAQWRKANEDEHIAIKLGEIGENKLNQAGNRLISPTDYLAAGGAYAASKDPLTAAAAVQVNRALRGREHAIAHQVGRGVQRTAEALGGALPRIGQAAASHAGVTGAASAAAAEIALNDPKYGNMLRAKKDPQARAFAISVLSAQDPEFRARMREAAQSE